MGHKRVWSWLLRGKTSWEIHAFAAWVGRDGGIDWEGGNSPELGQEMFWVRKVGRLLVEIALGAGRTLPWLLRWCPIPRPLIYHALTGRELPQPGTMCYCGSSAGRPD